MKRGGTLGEGRGRGELVVLGLLVLTGVLLAGLPPQQDAAATSRLRGTVLWPFLEAHRTWDRYLQLAGRVEELELERDSLARAVALARIARAENRQLRSLLSLPPEREGDVRAVDLQPGGAADGGRDAFAFWIDDDRGLSAPTAVFTEKGLLGVVRWTGAGRGRGDYWTHPDFRVSVRTASGEASGIVRPLRERNRPMMVLEGAPYQTEISPGTVLYTSGLGGIYPPGIPVGTVREVSGVESGWERSYRVEPAVRPEEADVALVWLPPEDDA